jgi:hypothetical protein
MLMTGNDVSYDDDDDNAAINHQPALLFWLPVALSECHASSSLLS